MRAGFARHRTSCSAASASRLTRSSGPCSSGSRRSTPSRQGSWSASIARRRRGECARGWRCASTRTSTPVRIPTSPPDCTSTSSAFRSSWRGELYRRMSAQPGLQPVGIHVHLGSQIISTEPIQRGRSRRGPAGAGAARIRASISITSTSAGGSAFPTMDPGADSGRVRRGRPADRRSVGPVNRARAGPIYRRCRSGAARARGRPEGRAGRASLRRARCRYDRADAADAIRRVSPHRRSDAPCGPRHALRHRRTGVREHRHVRRAIGG